jgi:hypothetical protein
VAGGKAGGVSLYGPWGPLGAFLQKASVHARWERALDRAIGKEAHKIAKMISDTFNAQGAKGKKWKPPAAGTLLMRRAKGKRGRTKALMVYGDLKGSIKVKHAGSTEWFVGIHRSAKGKRGGKALANVGAIHEFGAPRFEIPVTRKMRAYFWYLHIKTRGAWRPGTGRKPPKFMVMPIHPGKTEIRMSIPARPFIRPVWDAEKEESGNRIVKQTLVEIGWPGAVGAATGLGFLQGAAGSRIR